MEPCAPGTEDDPPIMYSTLTKKENEEDRLLSQKAFLRNGKYDNVFDLSFQNGSEHWYCNACECPVMGRVFQHELGRRHTQSISNTHHNVDNSNKGSVPEEPVHVEVAPGEPLPPGFEDIGRVSQIQERLDGFKAGPLVALEYLIELQDDDPSKEPFYLCILCDKKGDPRTVLTHLASYNHISQYLQKHFPTCWRVLAPYNTKQYRRNWQTALQKIAEGIETKFGRLKPFPIDKDKFEKDRMHYLQIVGKGMHFSEISGYTFEELVVHDELTKTMVMETEEKSYESSITNNWGTASYIEKPFKKRSPSPPVVGAPSKRTKGNAQTNPRKQEAAFVTQSGGTPANKPQNPPAKKHGEGAPPAGGTQHNRTAPRPSARPPARRRSLSSVSSVSDKSDKSDGGTGFGRGRGSRGRLSSRSRGSRGRPQFHRGDRHAQPDWDRQGRPGSPLTRRIPGRRRSPSPRRRSPIRRRSPSPNSARRRSPPANPSRRRSQSPSVKAEQEKEKLRKIEEFRKLGRAIENDLFKTLKQHEKNPEKHPQYNEEWKKFWNRRYKELKAEGVDVTKHDFKPEWIEFWNKRMVEIHSDELRNRKEALRKRLALPDEMSPIKFKIGTGPLTFIPPEKNVGKPLPVAAQPDQDNEVIIIDDKDDENDKKGVRSPWEDNSLKSRGGPFRKIIKPSSSPRSNRSRERSPARRARNSPIRRSSPPRYAKRSRSKERIKPRDKSGSRERIGLRDRSRSSDRPFIKKRSLSYEKHRTRNASPLDEISHTARPTKRQNSREKFSGRRSRSKDRSRSREKPVNQALSGNRITSRDRNISPVSDDSDISRPKETSRGRGFRDSRSHSRNRSITRNKGSSPHRRSLSRERRMARESSFERDLRGRERIRTVADLPWEREASIQTAYRNPYLPPPMMRDVTRKPVDVSGLPEDDSDDREVNVVDVLRLLTALEDRLGSLGPKVIDLLAQALALEKHEANSSEQLLDNEINCVLFETVKEKLKGQMFAGLVDHIQHRAFKRAIKKIASLIHLAGQRKRQREKLLPKMAAAATGGAVDKAAIAKQIANALIAQGKTDVTQAELEQLINAVVAMAEASKITSKPMTTAGFLQMLGGGVPSEATQDPQGNINRKSDLIELDKLVEPLTPSPGKNSVSNMENLSDSDLQTLLQNFKDLSTEEQHNLINYLKKLEYQEPERVEKLRKFVNLDPTVQPKEDSNEDVKEDSKEDLDKEENKPKTKNEGRESPFSNRSGGVNPDQDDLVNIESEEENDDKEDDAYRETEEDKQDKQDKKVVDSEEDEYTFDDVVKTVSKNVKDKEMEHSKKVLEDTMKYDKSKSNLSNAKDLISELMGNISKNNSNSNTIDLLGLGKPAASNPSSTNMANVDLTKLLNINVASLASIVNNVKNMSSNDVVDKQLDFRPPPLAQKQHKLNFDLGQLKPEPTKSGPGGLNRGPISLDRELLETNRPSDKSAGPDRTFPGGPNRLDGPGGPGYDRGPSRGEPDIFGAVPDRFGQGGLDRFRPGGPERFGPGGPDRFGPGGSDRFGPVDPDRFGPIDPDRFGPIDPDRFGLGGPERFGSGGPDRFRSGALDRFGPGGPDRFGPGGPDRFGPGGPDRFGPGGPDRFGPGGPDRLGTGAPDRLGAGGPDRLGMGAPDRLGPGGPDRLGPGGPDRLGPGGPDRFRPGAPVGFGSGYSGLDRGFGGQDRGFGGTERLGGPDRSGPGTGRPGLSGPGGPGIAGLSGARMGGANIPIMGGQGIGGPGTAGQFRANVLMENKGPGNFGPRSEAPFGNDKFPRGPVAPGPNDQRNFQRLPAPDFNRPAGNFNRW